MASTMSARQSAPASPGSDTNRMLAPLVHIALIAAYAIFAYFTAVEFTLRAAGARELMGYSAGVLLFLLLALIHFAASQFIINLRLQREIGRLAYDHQEMVVNVAATRHEVSELSSLASDGNVARSNSEIVSEMRVLRSLITQLPGQRGQSGANRTGTAKNDALTDTTTPLATPLPSNLSTDEVLDITRRALEDNRVDLYIQPIVNLPHRQVQFYESFSRVRHEDGGIILPEQYIPIATANGLISTIDNLLLFRCVQLIRRVHRNQSNLGFFCNISRDSLTDHEFFPQFIDFLEHNRELAGVLNFEFAQNDLALPDVNANLEQLAELGFSFSIDQVESLSLDIANLSRRSVRFVKVSAKTLLSERHQARAPVHINDLSDAMKRAEIALIAEKIETESTVIELMERNVGYGQGYLFGEPRPHRS